jgi:nitrogen fixation/metabolism regulation signal transduction histidine kinase
VEDCSRPPQEGNEAEILRVLGAGGFRRGLGTGGTGDREWVYVREGEDDAYETTSLAMSDGSVLQLGQTISEREDLLKRIRNIYLFAIIPIILVAYLGGLFVADRALNPIRQLINTLNSIVAKTKIDMRVPVRNEDKLNDELISLFNAMLDKIETR